MGGFECTCVGGKLRLKLLNLPLYRTLLSHHLNQSMVTKWRLLQSKQYKRQILKDTRLCKDELGKRSTYVCIPCQVLCVWEM